MLDKQGFMYFNGDTIHDIHGERNLLERIRNQGVFENNHTITKKLSL